MKQTPCLASIDCFRGFAVLAMVFTSHLAGTENLPVWLRHAPEGSLTSVKLETTWQIFAVNVNLLILLGGTP